MDTSKFQRSFDRNFPAKKINIPTPWHKHWFWRRFFDPCFDVYGQSSVKKQLLLKMAFSFLEPDECYLEVGTYQGKSLISAIKGNPARAVYAVDNFSINRDHNSQEILMANLKRYGMCEKVKFINADFASALNKKSIAHPVGLYFYDGDHGEQSQYQAIKIGEPLLADEALVVIDDWRRGPDSGSYAKEGTERAIAESGNSWAMLYNLPARFNQDCELWWNGVAVFSFRRKNSGLPA